MKKLYTLPKMEVLSADQADILTVSIIHDEENLDNIVRDPFARAE